MTFLPQKASANVQFIFKLPNNSRLLGAYPLFTKDFITFKFQIMKKKNVHVVPKGDNWAVKSAGSTRPAKVTGTQKEAIDRAREIAKNNNSEMLVHGRNGRIRQKNSFGNDPHPPEG
nr:DUF2188 domain-containing protein [uncultured Carboxylicivirga sp.]